MQVLLVVLLVCCVAVTHGSKGKNVPDAFCSSKFDASEAIAIETTEIVETLANGNATISNYLVKTNKTLKYLVEELQDLLDVDLNYTLTKVLGEITPFLDDHVVIKARNAYEDALDFATSVNRTVKIFTKKLPSALKEFAGNYVSKMDGVRAGIIEDGEFCLSAVALSVQDKIPNAVSCACSTLRNFIGFCADSLDLLQNCGSVGLEEYKQTSSLFHALIKDLQESLVMPLNSLSHCFYNTARKVTEESKTLLNACLEIESNKMLVYSEELSVTAHTVLKYIKNKSNFHADKFRTCVAVTNIEFLRKYHRFIISYQTCTSFRFDFSPSTGNSSEQGVDNVEMPNVDGIVFE